MNPKQSYIVGPDRAPIMGNGTVRVYREILTPDGRELIGREYPNESYCWFNLTRAALNAGLSHDDIFQEEQAARDLIYNDAYIAAHRAELLGLRP